MKLLLDPEALQETRDAAVFYEDSRPGLGKAFLDEVEVATKEILRHPHMWRCIKERFRRYLIPRFPYGVIYAVQGDTVYVAAVMHLKRRPGYWVARTRKAPR